MFESSSTLEEGPTVIFLARHGETVWNIERRFQGHQDSPLTERGLEQARLLAERLAGEPLVAVYSSDLGRTSATAEPVAARHGLPVQTSSLLREIDTGVWTGRPRDEVRAVPEWAAMLKTYRKRPWKHRMPEGESIGDVQARGLAFVRGIASRHAGQAIAVISHHVVVETLVARALGVPLRELWLPYRGGNCFLSVLEVRSQQIVPRVIYDGSHIGELAGLDGTKGEPGSDGGA